MSTSKQWYAVYTRPKAQKRVSELLTKKRVECFCPVNNVLRQKGDKNKVFYEQLFNGYVFVKASEAQHTLIRQVEGVVSFIHWQNLPAVFKDNEVNMLKHVLNEYYNIRLEKIKVNSDEQMVILEDELIQDKNILENYKKPVKVYLPSMGYVLTADVKSPEGKIVSLPAGAKNRKEQLFKIIPASLSKISSDV